MSSIPLKTIPSGNGSNIVRLLGQVTAVLGFAIVYLCGIPHAAADPSWNMVETACSSNNGGCQAPLGLPLTIGATTGSGTYTSTAFGPFSESGDFSIDFGQNTNFTSSSPAYCTSPADSQCSVNISLTDTISGVTGILDFVSHGDMTNIQLAFSGTTFSGTWGSDGTLQGCGTFANCTISGELIPAPEPSSGAVLVAAIIGFAFVGYRATQRARV